MNNFVTNLTLDLNCSKDIQTIDSAQFDKGRVFSVSITANGEPFSVSGCQATLKCVHSDKTGSFLDCTGGISVSGTEVTVTLSEDTLPVRGITAAKLVFTDGDRNYSTQIFLIDVDSSLEVDVRPTAAYSILNQLIDQIHALNENGLILVDNEITENGENPVSGGTIYDYVNGAIENSESIVRQALNEKVDKTDKSVKTEQLATLVTAIDGVDNGRFPELDTQNKILKIHKSTTMLMRQTGQNVDLAPSGDVQIDYSNVAGTAVKIYYNLGTNSFNAVNSSTVGGANDILICTIRDLTAYGLMSHGMSISCPYIIDGKLFGVNISDFIANNSITESKLATAFTQKLITNDSLISKIEHLGVIMPSMQGGFPELDTVNNTLTLHKNTNLMLRSVTDGETQFVSLADNTDVVVDYSSIASSAVKIYFNLSTNILRGVAYSTAPSAQDVLICAIRDVSQWGLTNHCMSISCPYIIDGKLFGVNLVDYIPNDSITESKLANAYKQSIQTSLNGKISTSDKIAKIEPLGTLVTALDGATHGRFPELDTSSKALKFYKSTLLVMRNGQNVDLAPSGAVTVSYSDISSTSIKIYYNLSNNSLSAKESGYSSNVNDVLICTIRDETRFGFTEHGMSISCPYIIDGKLFGVDMADYMPDDLQHVEDIISNPRIDICWEHGTLWTSIEADDTKRIRSDFILVGKGTRISLGNPNYQHLAFKYDLRENYLSNNGLTQNDITINEDCYIRIVMAKVDNGEIGENEISTMGGSEIILRAIPQVIIDNTPDWNDIIPSYYQPQLKTAIDSALNNITATGIHGESLIFISDPHEEANAGYSPALIKEVTSRLNIDKIICGGDMVEGGSKATIIKKFNDFVSAFRRAGKFFTVFGNHDTNTIGPNGPNDASEHLTKGETYALMQKQMDFDVQYGGLCYYFFDNPTTKTRFIVLDTGLERTELDNAQRTWFENALSNMPSDYHALIFAHIIYMSGTWYVGVSPDVFTRTDFMNDICAICDRFNSAENGKTVEAIFGGHTHLDLDPNLDPPDPNDPDHVNKFKSAGGIPIIIIDCDAMTTASADGQGNRDAVRGTITEQCFDIVTIDYIARIIYCVRIGRGNDRTISY